MCCPKCSSPTVIKRGKDEAETHRQRYQCKDCSAHFDDLTSTIFALASSAVAGVDAVPVFNGIERVESSNCPGTRP